MESYRKPSVWPPSMADPSGVREKRPRTAGKTMVIDKGLGPYAFFDLLQVGGSHIDYIKLGFGSAPLYPVSVLKQKSTLPAGGTSGSCPAAHSWKQPSPSVKWMSFSGSSNA